MSWQAEQPFNRMVDVSLSDTANFDGTVSGTGAFRTAGNTQPTPCDALWFSDAGTVVLIQQNSQANAVKVIAGQVVDQAVIRCNSSGSTYTGTIKALYFV